MLNFVNFVLELSENIVPLLLIKFCPKGKRIWSVLCKINYKC